MKKKTISLAAIMLGLSAGIAANAIEEQKVSLEFLKLQVFQLVQLPLTIMNVVMIIIVVVKIIVEMIMNARSLIKF